jgi:hypothetical protein
MSNWARGRDTLEVTASPFHRSGIRIRVKHEVQRDRRVSEAEERTLLAACAKLDEPSFHSKLTWEDVNDIRARVAKGESQKSIADDHGIGSALCSQIVRNRIWNPAIYVPLTCGQKMRDRIVGALETGCRQGEMQKFRTATSIGTATRSRSRRRTRRPVSLGASRLIQRGGSVRFSAGDDLSEGQGASYSATRPELSSETSIVCGAR